MYSSSLRARRSNLARGTSTKIAAALGLAMTKRERLTGSDQVREPVGVLWLFSNRFKCNSEPVVCVYLPLTTLSLRYDSAIENYALPAGRLPAKSVQPSGRKSRARLQTNVDTFSAFLVISTLFSTCFEVSELLTTGRS